MRRLLITKAILWFLVGAAAMLAVLRFWQGLGATTALTDLTPWGFWIGFDVMGGVALAVGGFVMAATVYVFRLEKYHAVVRPAVLTAFLGYVAVVFALLFDLGLPWNIWHMIIYWNPHSPLFEVGWCVMLYSSVLALEFGPVLLEGFDHPQLKKAYAFLKKATVPLVVLGIMLSSLHQSSLGSLFLLMPHRLHAIWYTPILPILFFTSAVSLALCMVTLESLVSAWLYEKEPELDLLQGLAKVAAYVLAGYALLKLGDVAARGRLSEAYAGDRVSILFNAELLLSAVIPAILFGTPALRKHRSVLTLAAGLGVAGFVFNRLNVGGIATISVTGTDYIPSWTELFLSLGIVAGAMLVYFFVAEHFNLFHAGKVDKEKFRFVLPKLDPGTQVVRMDPFRGSVGTFSIAGALGSALVLAFAPVSAFGGSSIASDPITPPGYGARILIDGNRRDMSVTFEHQRHVEREGANSCATCHHLLRPHEQASGCSRCHQDMNQSTPIFDHDLHAKALEEGEGCVACHLNEDAPKTLEGSKACVDCHTKMVAEGSRITLKHPARPSLAPGYEDAMHGLCVKCHEERVQSGATQIKTLSRCDTCHQAKQPTYDPMRPDEPWKL